MDLKVIEIIEANFQYLNQTALIEQYTSLSTKEGQLSRKRQYIYYICSDISETPYPFFVSNLKKLILT